MSINAKQNVKCPNCGEMSQVTVWSSITAKDSPDLVEDLLMGRINMFCCKSCSHTALMPNPMLFQDEDKKLLISFTPTNDAVLKAQLYDNIKKASRESGEIDNYEGYNLRFVTDYNELLEKVLIFKNGLYDKTIEVIKLMILSNDIDKSEQRVCRFGKSDENGMEFMIHDFIENQIYTSTIPQETYETVHKSLIESGMKPYSFDWEIVDSVYATRLINGFNNNF